MRLTDHAAAYTSCLALCAAMLFGVASAPVAARIPAVPAAESVAILTIMKGDVLIRTAHGDFSPAVDGAVLYAGTVLRTGADARALITLFEGSTVELDPASDITIEDMTARSGYTLAQAFGRGLRVVMRLTSADSRYEPSMPASTASVRGIEFEVAVAGGVGAAPITLLLAAQVVAPAVAMPQGVTVGAAQPTTVRTAAGWTRSMSGAKVRRVIAAPLTTLAPTAGRARGGDDRDADEDEDDD